MNPKSSETNEFPVTADGDLLARAEQFERAIMIGLIRAMRDRIAELRKMEMGGDTWFGWSTENAELVANQFDALLAAYDGQVEEVRTLRAQVTIRRDVMQSLAERRQQCLRFHSADVPCANCRLFVDAIAALGGHLNVRGEVFTDNDLQDAGQDWPPSLPSAPTEPQSARERSGPGSDGSGNV